MKEPIITALLWFSALGCGLMAGVYFAFSAFIMTAFNRNGPAHGIAAMNAINAVILRSLFMPLFAGTTLASLLLAIIGIARPNEPSSISMIAGGLIYVAGMFLCTAVRHVPLNNSLAAIDPTSETAASAWAQYLKYWTAWNHLRTISSLVASALFTLAIAAR